MYREIENLPEDIYGIEMFGEMDEEDYKKMNVSLENYSQKHKNIKFLMVIRKFEWKNFQSFWADLKMDVKYLGEVTKNAVVTELDWMENISKAINAITPKMKVKTFHLDQQKEAVAWLESEE